jgi:hypothetical protein
MQAILKGSLTGSPTNTSSYELVSLTPKKLKGSLEGKYMSQVVCAPHHVVALSYAGHVFSWGSGTYGGIHTHFVCS